MASLNLTELVNVLHKLAHPADHDLHEAIDALDTSSSSSGRGGKADGGDDA